MLAHALVAPAAAESRPLRLSETQELVPGTGQVRVKVHVCAVCRTDLHIIEGDLTPRRQSIVPGHQVVGTVDACGANVDPALLHQRVGVAWLHGTCGHCSFCQSARENLCEQPEVRTVANNTREDGRRFPEEAARVKAHTSTQLFPFEAANDALIELKQGRVNGSAVLQVSS